MGWKRRSVLATMAGTIVGATSYDQIPLLDGTDSPDPSDSTESTAMSEPDLVELGQVSDTIEIRPCNSVYYELDAAVVYFEWRVDLGDPSQLVSVFVLRGRAFGKYVQGDSLRYFEPLSVQEVYKTERSGWLNRAKGPFVIFFENPSSSRTIELSFTYIEKRLAGGSTRPTSTPWKDSFRDYETIRHESRDISEGCRARSEP